MPAAPQDQRGLRSPAYNDTRLPSALMSFTAISRSLTLHLAAAFDWCFPRAHWALLAGMLLVGLSVVGDYGQSWDELGIYGYGAQSLRGNLDLGNAPAVTEYDAYLDHYGPAYFALASLVSGLITRASPELSTTQVWHMLNFLMFTLAAGMLHALCRRWLGAPASLGAAALFAVQPLLWGHAFVNPKDIPFMALFSVSVVAGFSMVDRISSGRKTLLATTAAAALLGVTTSVRAAGPWAGILVSVYALLTLRRHSLRWLLLYALLATVASFLTWPFLWVAPLDRLSQAVVLMSSFPFLPEVQFMGAFYLGSELPWFYVPAIFAFQLTESTLVLVVVGLALALWSAFRSGTNQSRSRAILLLFLGWSLLPILLLLVLGSTLYDNARQLFFVLPPLFVLAGLALDVLLNSPVGAHGPGSCSRSSSRPVLWPRVRCTRTSMFTITAWLVAPAEPMAPSRWTTGAHPSPTFVTGSTARLPPGPVSGSTAARHTFSPRACAPTSRSRALLMPVVTPISTITSPWRAGRQKHVAAAPKPHM